jgi:hypothetical protein
MVPENTCAKLGSDPSILRSEMIEEMGLWFTDGQTDTDKSTRPYRPMADIFILQDQSQFLNPDGPIDGQRGHVSATYADT